MPRFPQRSATAVLIIGVLLVAIFATMVIWFRSDLRDEIHLTILDRDAAVLYPMAVQQLAESEGSGPLNSRAPLISLLRSAKQKGMLAVAVFDQGGNVIEAVPSTQLFVELPTDDYLRLQGGQLITRYHPAFPLDQYFLGVSPGEHQAPVLEVLLPLPGADHAAMRGFVRYYIDARSVARELALIDRRINRQTMITLLVGAALITLVLAVAGFSVLRAQRVAAERSERLIRANYELTLAAKASVIGQITAHLIHGLQGSVEGLRAVLKGLGADDSSPAWESAAGYTARLQTIIQETIALLGDAGAHASYELSGVELAATVLERNLPSASKKGVILDVAEGFPAVVDSHRGNLLCLIASNLVQNAIFATNPGNRVSVSFVDSGQVITLTIRDEGSGIPDSVQKHLFEPGKSTRPDGSGLGLAISKLLARQIGAELKLVSTAPTGSTFTVTLSRTR
jgi:signal transduction histidine kinase